MQLIERFQRVAADHPNSLAVADVRESLSYGQLARRVAAEARRLRGSRSASRAILCLPRGVDFVVRLLALWQRGMVPVPLDPELPLERREDIAALALSTSSQHTLAYAIATSGSSGLPKLVEVLPDGLLPMLEEQIQYFELAPGARALWMLSPGFDASLSDVLTALLSGASLICAPPGAAASLPAILREQAITHLDIPPALLECYSPQDFPNALRTLVVGGAPSEPARLRDWAGHFRVVSVYGPTEATVCSSLSVVDEGWDAPYLGQPIAGLQYRVVDNELLIGGPGVARGYAVSKGEPQPSFWTEEGTRWYRTGDLVRQSSSHHGLIFVGRRDRQVKLYGHRIELEEIEARLRPLLGAGVTVLVAENGTLEVVWEGPARAEEAQRLLSQTLPKAWLPRSWRRLDSLPRLCNGKVDLRAVSALQGETLTYQHLGWDSLEVAQRAIALERAGQREGARRLLHKSCCPPQSPERLGNIAEEMLGKSVRHPRKASRPSTRRRTLLVTGGSGRLGEALLPKLRTDFDLVLLQHRHVLPPGPGRIVQGDLGQYQLGLNTREWQALRGEIDGVLHLAAALAPPGLPAALALNAAPLLELEALGVPIHHASTLTVCLLSQPPPPIFEAVHTPDWILGCYAQSKWIAERLWEGVGSGGSMFRYGLLLGSPTTDDLLSLFVDGLLALGCYPGGGVRHLAFDATALEYAAEATHRHLLEGTPGTVLTVSQRVKVTLQDLVEDLAALGHPLTQVTNDDFFRLPALDAGSSVAQLALTRLLPSTSPPPEFDLFLMSETAWLEDPLPGSESGNARETWRGHLATLLARHRNAPSAGADAASSKRAAHTAAGQSLAGSP